MTRRLVLVPPAPPPDPMRFVRCRLSQSDREILRCLAYLERESPSGKASKLLSEALSATLSLPEVQMTLELLRRKGSLP